MKGVEKGNEEGKQSREIKIRRSESMVFKKLKEY